MRVQLTMLVLVDFAIYSSLVPHNIVLCVVVALFGMLLWFLDV